MNKFDFFTPLMHKCEYEFIQKYINSEDIFLEYGSGSSTLYFSGLVKKLISIEHDIDYYRKIQTTIETFNADNIELYHIPSKKVNDPIEQRYESLENYIKFPRDFKFTKVLIDGRARKHCAQFLSEFIDENVIVFIHDFNHNTVEGYVDDNYFSDILKNYDIVDFERQGQGIVALKVKKEKNITVFNTRTDLFKSFYPKQIIAELGVFRGDFSHTILRECKPKELHLIDVFQGITHSGDKDGKNIIDVDLNKSYVDLAKKYKNKNVFIHKGDSTTILKSFDDNYFDIIYIDADHSYEGVMADLELSYKKIRRGGVITGHDYDTLNHIQVYMAVNKFCLDKNLKIDSISLDDCPSYGITLWK